MSLDVKKNELCRAEYPFSCTTDASVEALAPIFFRCFNFDQGKETRRDETREKGVGESRESLRGSHRYKYVDLIHRSKQRGARE